MQLAFDYREEIHEFLSVTAKSAMGVARVSGILDATT